MGRIVVTGHSMDDWHMPSKEIERWQGILGRIEIVYAGPTADLPIKTIDKTERFRRIETLAAQSAETGWVDAYQVGDVDVVTKKCGKGMKLGLTRDEAVELRSMIRRYELQLKSSGLAVARGVGALEDMEIKEGDREDGMIIHMLQERINGVNCDKLLANVVQDEGGVKKVLMGLLDAVDITSWGGFGRSMPHLRDETLRVCLDAKPANFILKPDKEEVSALITYVDTFLPHARDRDGVLEIFNALGSERMIRYDKGFTSIYYRLGTDVGIILKFTLETLAALTHNPHFKDRMDDTREMVEGNVLEYVGDYYKLGRDPGSVRTVYDKVKGAMGDDYHSFIVQAGDGECDRYRKLRFINPADLGAVSTKLQKQN